MSKKAEERAKEFDNSLNYYESTGMWPKEAYKKGYEQAEQDIISFIEQRLSELLGDAQPTPILRYELRDLIKKIRGGEE